VKSLSYKKTMTAKQRTDILKIADAVEFDIPEIQFYMPLFQTKAMTPEVWLSEYGRNAYGSERASEIVAQQRHLCGTACCVAGWANTLGLYESLVVLTSGGSPDYDRLVYGGYGMTKEQKAQQIRDIVATYVVEG
jgi:hypothetical protein